MPKEIDTLNRIVVMFLDQAESRAQRRWDIRMADWSAFLDKFLRDTDVTILLADEIAVLISGLPASTSSL